MPVYDVRQSCSLSTTYNEPNTLDYVLYCTTNNVTVHIGCVPYREAAASRRLERGTSGGYSARSASNVPEPPSLAVAITNLERYCDSLENRLLEAFSVAEAAGDTGG